MLSDLYDPRGFERGLDVLRHHGDEIQVIQLIDGSEGEPVLKGDLDLTDCETSATRTVTVTERHLRQYRRIYRDFLGQCEKTCRQREVGFIRSTTDVPFEDLVLKVLRRGGAVT